MSPLKPRPIITEGKTHKVKTGCGSLYVTVNIVEGLPFEIFTRLGKSGGCAYTQVEAISRLVSAVLRLGGDVKDIVHQLSGLRCNSPIYHEGSQILSCPDGVAYVLKKYIAEKGSNVQSPDSTKKPENPPA